MRLTINKEQFLKGLNVASRAVPSKSPTPILTYISLTLDERGLEILGSNGELTVCSTVPYMLGDKEIIRNAGLGSTLVNSKILVEVIRKLEGEEVSVEVIDDAVMKIDDGKSSFKLNCLKGTEYPDIDLNVGGVEFEIGCITLSCLIDQSAFAASSKEQRPILTALHLEADGEKLVATATDSARLARKEIPLDADVRFACNIPARTISDIVKMFDTARSVEITVSDRSMIFRFENTVVSSRLIPGDYPVTKSIIPHNFNHTLEVNSSELLASIERVRILSNESEPVVKLTMKEEAIEVSARNDRNGSAFERLSIFNYSGDPLSVSFNSQFAIDAIKAVKSEDVTICFLGEMKPFVVKNPKDDSVIELITPMRTF